MKKEIYKAAVRGDVVFLHEARTKDVEAVVADYCDDDLLELTSHGNNIIHLAAKHGHLDFLKVALSENFISDSNRQKWVCSANADGDTPIHLAAKQPNQTVVEQLITYYLQLPSCCTKDAPPLPWRVQNNKGNTPLHTALMNGGKCVQVAAYLVGVGPEVASYCNHRKETPLHVAVKYNNQGAKVSTKTMLNTLNGLGSSVDYTKSHFEADSFSLIELLLATSTSVCCLQDEDGMTPLLRATLNSYLLAVEAIIDYCPESVEIYDAKGRTILHHIKFPTFLDARKFLSTPEIFALLDEQDEDGNTPLHLAIMNCSYSMAKAIIECNANLVIQNNEGISAASLIQLESSSFLDNVKDNMKLSSNKDELMSKELYEAAGKGEWEYLRERLKEHESGKYFLSLLPDGSNIIHVAVEESLEDYNNPLSKLSEDASLQELFIMEALEKFPILICQTNYLGQTPLYLAMMQDKIMNPDGRFFTFLKGFLKLIKEQSSCFPLPPWEAKEKSGNSLLHLALEYRRYEFATFLIEELDENIVGEHNHENQYPLHYLCFYGGIRITPSEKAMVDLLIEKDVTTVYSCEAFNGFTPLLSAVYVCHPEIAARILHHCPQSVKQFDSKSNKNMFHSMNLLFPEEIDMAVQNYFKVPQTKYLLTLRDGQGNTPLHVTIKQRLFRTAKVFMEYLDSNIRHCRKSNHVGETVLGLLYDAVEDCPQWFQEYLLSKPLHRKEVRCRVMFDNKTVNGIRHSDLKEYMGSLGVVAALLTTITFTAAFTVPGGYNDNGSPILANEVAFQIFMFTDVLGMCSSIMVLFCLIWFLSSRHIKREGSRLVDLSIGLLQLSFFSTLTAFMTGVYVTTFPEVHWLAIFTCVLCSVVLVLMKKSLILNVVARLYIRLYFMSRYLSIFTIFVPSCLRFSNQAL